MDAKCCSMFYFLVSTFAIPMLLIVGYFLHNKDQKYIGEIPEDEAEAAASGCFIAAGIYGGCCLISALVYCTAERRDSRKKVVRYD